MVRMNSNRLRISIYILLAVTILVACSRSSESTEERKLEAPKIQLPKAKNGTPMKAGSAPIIDIDPGLIRFRGQVVATNETVKMGAEVGRIEPLVESLNTYRRKWMAENPDEFFRGEVVIAADASVENRVLKKTLFSAAQAGYENYRLLVGRRGDVMICLPVSEHKPPIDVEYTGRKPEPGPMVHFVQVTASGYVLSRVATETVALPEHGESVDLRQYRETLRQWQKDQPELNEVVICGEDGIRYADLITAIDEALSAGYGKVLYTGYTF
jgi:biopolymer transport protein ExbD